MPTSTDPSLADTSHGGADDDPTCALLTRTHQGQLPGTAPVAAGWVLVEQPGAWGRDALTASALDPALGAHLGDVAGDEVRVVLIRRPGNHATVHPARRTVIVAHAGPTPWAERLELTNDAQLWDLVPALAARPTAPGVGAPITDPLWLVCTHGKRDRCCAEYGRPIVDALAERYGEDVWEVSHIGGHRFAGNLLSLPGGEVYGLLDVDTALHAVDLQRAGRYDVAHLRGRSGLGRPAQAAELLARRTLGRDGRDQVRVLEAAPGPGTAATSVRLRIDGVDHRAVVRAEPTGVRYLQSCDKDEPADPGRFVLDTLEPV